MVDVAPDRGRTLECALREPFVDDRAEWSLLPLVELDLFGGEVVEGEDVVHGTDAMGCAQGSTGCRCGDSGGGPRLASPLCPACGAIVAAGEHDPPVGSGKV